MNDVQRTTIFAAAAAALLVLTLITMPGGAEDPADVAEQGGLFYPEFADPLAAASLEVIEWDSALSLVKRFRVEKQADGRWVIPSHNNYPADAEERLARTAGRVVGLRKDVMRSKDKKEHETFGVVDPEETDVVEADARGKRVILRDKDGNTLADYIFGKKTGEGGTELVYVRAPGKDKTYAVKSDAEITAKFEDWIETDLLKLSASDIRKIVIDNYSIDEVKGVIKDRHSYFIARDESADPWKMGELKEDEEVNTTTVQDMTSTLDDLKIVGVREKPAALRQTLQQGGFAIDPITEALLRGKGYYVLRQRDPKTGQVFGQLVSNEGEIDVLCGDGLVYTLRFGEILVGTGEAITAGSEEENKQPAPKEKKDEKKDETKGGTEHRYLFVTARFDKTLLGNPPSPPAVPEKKPGEKKEGEKKEEEKKEEGKKDGEQDKKDPAQEKYEKDKAEYETKKKEYDEKVEKGTKRAGDLSRRFAQWYYVINAESFKKLRKERKDLVKKKEKTEEEKKKEEEEKKGEEKEGEEKTKKKTKDVPKGDEPEDKKPDGGKQDDKKPEEKKDGNQESGKKPEESKPPGKKKPE